MMAILATPLSDSFFGLRRVLTQMFVNLLKGIDMNSNQRKQGNKQSDNGAKQGVPGVHESNDLAGGLPRSPAGNHQSADEKMDDDTGLSNTANREPSELDQNERQEQQSNVGRRDDGTPD
jgi:hypothetical protein